jgi:FkbM family methyltransferase
VIRRTKQRLRRLRLHCHGIREARSVPKRAFGDGSGSWVVCDPLVNRDSVIYSFGVGTDISFDKAISASSGAKVFLFDPTPRSVSWVQNQSLPDELHFTDVGIASYDGDMTFFPPRRERSSHYAPIQRYRSIHDGQAVEAKVKTLNSLMHSFGHERVDVLKLDIEGGEYDVLQNIMEANVPVGQLLVEFHHSYATVPFARTVDTIRDLRDCGFEVFHISRRTYEFSFVHRSASANLDWQI